jgi:hypothetical protein
VSLQDPPDWERLLAAERHLQSLVPGAVLVGGTAAALHAGHRKSLDGVMTGIRQLRRTRALETEVVDGLRVPTLAEMARVKAWLLATRHTVRDYLDTVVLLERLGAANVNAAFASFDEIYAQESGASPLVEVVERLGVADPSDRTDVDLATYKGLVAPWNDWSHLADRGRSWARLLARNRLAGGPS